MILRWRMRSDPISHVRIATILCRSGVLRKTEVEEDERAWLGYVLSGLDWESRCPCLSEVVEEKQRWPEVEREKVLWRRWERGVTVAVGERCDCLANVVNLALHLKWVMCVAHDSKLKCLPIQLTAISVCSISSKLVWKKSMSFF